MAKKTLWQSSLRIFSWITVRLAIVFNFWAGFRAAPLNGYFVLVFYAFAIPLALWASGKDLTEVRAKRSTFSRELKDAFTILLFFASLNLSLERVEWFKHFEYVLLDTFTRGKGTIARDVLVVEITQQEHSLFVLPDCRFAHLFISLAFVPPVVAGRLSSDGCPLDPAKVTELIRAAKSAGADVIGVDVDTCDAMHCDQDRYPGGWNSKDFEKEFHQDKVVWAEVPQAAEVSEESQSGTAPSLTLNCVLGHEAPDKHNSGIVRFEQENGIVRMQQAEYAVKPSNECPGKSPSQFPSFHSVVIQKRNVHMTWWQCMRQYMVSQAGKVYLNFPAKDLQAVDASHFCGWESHMGLPCTATDIVQKQFLKGKIVLIGGAFDAADNYVTPFGKMPGVELLADAIASDLHGPILPGEWRPVQIGALVLDMVFGIFIVGTYFLFGKLPATALVMSLTMITIAFVACWVLFYYVGIWINPIFVMFGMLIHQEHESTHKWQWSLEELRQAAVAIRNLQAEKNRAEMAAWEARLDYLAEKLVRLLDELTNRGV